MANPTIFTSKVKYPEINKKEKNKLSFRNNIINIYKKELRKTHREQLATKRKLEYITVKNEMEIANLKYRKYKTRSENVKKECDLKIKSLQQEILNFENKVKELQAVKRQIAFAVASDNL